MKKQIPFEKDFESWLVNEKGLIPAKANSYSSYVNSALKNLNTPIEFLLYFIHNNDQTQKIKLFIDLLNNTLEYYHKEGIEYNENVLSSWKIGLIRYIEYLGGLLDSLNSWVFSVRLPTVNAAVIRSNPLLTDDKVTLVYTREELIEYLISRLMSLDICFGDICFPISLIARILYKDKQTREEFDRMLRDFFNKIQIHTKSRDFSLEEIDKLKIIDAGAKKTIIVVVGNKEHVVQTPTHTGSFEDMCVSQLRDISVAYDKSFRKTIKDLAEKNKLTEIEKLCEAIYLEFTESLKQSNGTMGNISPSDFAESQRLRNLAMRSTYQSLIENNIGQTVNTEQLLKEVKELFDEMKLHLIARN